MYYLGILRDACRKFKIEGKRYQLEISREDQFLGWLMLFLLPPFLTGDEQMQPDHRCSEGCDIRAEGPVGARKPSHRPM